MTQPVYEFRGEELIEETLADRVREKVDVEITSVREENEVRIEQFVFERIGGQWLLVRAYLEE
jgi:hypothetical protein